MWPLARARQDEGMRLLKKIVGSVVLLFSLPFVAMAAWDLVTGGGDTRPGVLVGLLVLFSATSLAGALLIRGSRNTSGGAGVPLEVLALRQAKAHGGTLGAAQLAAAIGVPLVEARRVLEGCVRQGACTVLVDENGAELYRFAELALAPGQAAKAKDLLAE